MSYSRKIIFVAFRYATSVLACLYLHTVGWLWGRNRELMITICRHFGLPAWKVETSEVRVKPLIPVVSRESLVPWDPPVQILEPIETGGNVSLYELFCINQLAVKHCPRAIWEIGTFDGRTTLNLAANSPENALVYTLDLPREMINDTALSILSGERHYVEKESSGKRFKNHPSSEKIVQKYGDSATFDFSSFAGAMDMVFIDGSHAYDYVRNDTDIAIKLIKSSGGIILWHDYGKNYGQYQSVTLALNEMYRGGGKFTEMKWIEHTSLVVLNVGRSNTVKMKYTR